MNVEEKSLTWEERSKANGPVGHFDEKAKSDVGNMFQIRAVTNLNPNHEDKKSQAKKTDCRHDHGSFDQNSICQSTYVRKMPIRPEAHHWERKKGIGWISKNKINECRTHEPISKK